MFKKDFEEAFADEKQIAFEHMVHKYSEDTTDALNGKWVQDNGRKYDSQDR